MIIYGKNAVKEALYANRPINKVLIDDKFSDDKLLLLMNQKGIIYEKSNKGQLNQLTQQALHQGIVAYVKDYEYLELQAVINTNVKQRFIILDEIQDPHNLGAILRSAEASAIDGVIVSKKHQVPLNGTVAKVSSGALEHVRLILVSNIHQAIMKLQENHFLVVGTDGGAKISYKDIPKEESIAIVLGNEGVGIRPLVKKTCDLLVSIPMKGKVNSLNVSVAAALLMYATLE